MNKAETNQFQQYPWKSFGLFMGIYLISLALHYPGMLEQAKLYLSIFGKTIQTTPHQMVISGLIQPVLLGVIAIYFGHRYAPKVQLRSLLTEQIENSTPLNQYTLKNSVPFIVSAAALVAILELGFDFTFQNWLPEIFQPQYAVPTIGQALSSIFYSGLAQEMLLRWGVMTAVIYVLSSKGNKMTEMHQYLGLVFTSILYAFSQYNAILGYVDLSFIIILRILLLSGLAGILFGWLYKTFHFEAAVLSHMLANILILLGNIVIIKFPSF